ncbi:PAS domain-containing protein [Aquisalimonas asiatica]|uniref:PAS domain S-box-containing protein n=1 Tax=Aquisalimonas asiatica TaxID=406100 RepID=A0A1H8QQH8_9GAMM|nr:PAS domain-containing protein [Aquisalimonas asiatica]SEO56469.1 PAS domain S-box-containing protein [Aquisalimonas asiatica]
MRPWLDTFRLVLAGALLGLGAMITVASSSLALTAAPGFSGIDPLLREVSLFSGLSLALAGAGWMALVGGVAAVAALLAAIAVAASLLALSGGWLAPADIAGGSVAGLIGAALLVASLPDCRFFPWRVVGALGLIASALMGYSGMPVEALALAVAGGLALSGAPLSGAASPPEKHASLVLPVAAYGVLLLGTLVLWQVILHEERGRWAERTDRVVDRFHLVVAADLDLRVDAMERMAGRSEERPDMAETEWRQDAAAYIAHFAGLEGIGMADHEAVPRWIQGRLWLEIAAPGGLRHDPRITMPLEAARRSGRTRLSPALQPLDGGAFVYTLTPVRGSGDGGGFVVGLSGLDTVFRHARAGVEPGFRFQVREAGGRHLFGPEAGPDAGGHVRAERDVAVHGAGWTVAAWPAPRFLAQERSRVGDAVLISGVLLALIGLVAMRLALLARERAVLAARNAHALRREIQEREQAEANRQATALRLEHTLDGLADGFMTLNADYRVTYVNRVTCELAGVRERDVIGKPLRNLFPDNRPIYDSLYARVMETGQPLAEEVHDPTLDRWLDVRVYPAEDGIAVYLRDVTEARASRDQLRFQAQILEHIHEAVIGSDLAGNITFWNGGAERLFGYDADTMVGGPLRLLRPGPDQLSLRREFMEPVLTKGAHELQLQLETSDGEPFVAMISLSLTRDSDGRATGVLAFILDMTERVAFETDLQEALTRAQIYARRLRELGRISLELNTSSHWRRTVETLAREARELLESHLCQVTVLDDGAHNGLSSVIAASQKYPGYGGSQETLAPDWLWEQLRRSRAPVLLTEAEYEDENGEPTFPRCGLGVPIVNHDATVIGVVFCADRYRGEFTADDEAIGVQLAQFAGAVLAKSQALEAMRVADAQLREQLEFLSTVTRSVTEGIVVTDARGVIDYVNPAAKTLLNRDQAELVGHRLLDLLGETQPVVTTPGEVSDAWKTTIPCRDGGHRTLVFRVSQLAEGRWQNGRVLVFSEEH